MGEWVYVTNARRVPPGHELRLGDAELGFDGSGIYSRPMVVQAEPATSPLLDSLSTAIRRTLIARLPVDPSCTMSALDVRSLIAVYVTWKERVPSTTPRRVHVSRELLANPVRAQYGDGLRSAVREIAFGTDLRPRMSTGVDHAYEPWMHPAIERKRRDGRHLDRLLAEWGVHHLHLRTSPHPKLSGFKARSRHVLFAVFRGDSAYLIDLYDHESDGANWSELAILEVIARNWPDAGIIEPIGTDLVTGLVGGNPSDEKRRALRRAGVSVTAAEIDGQVWAVVRGQTLTGESSRGANHAMMVKWFLMGYQPTHAELAGELSGFAEKHDVPDVWRGWVLGEDYGFLSNCAGVFVPYGSLLP